MIQLFVSDWYSTVPWVTGFLAEVDSCRSANRWGSAWAGPSLWKVLNCFEVSWSLLLAFWSCNDPSTVSSIALSAVEGGTSKQLTFHFFMFIKAITGTTWQDFSFLIHGATSQHIMAAARQLEDSLRRMDARVESLSSTASHCSGGLRLSGNWPTQLMAILIGKMRFWTSRFKGGWEIGTCKGQWDIPKVCRKHLQLGIDSQGLL